MFLNFCNVYLYVQDKTKTIQNYKQHLWHIESRLSDGELEDGSGSVCVSQDYLQLSKLDPGGTVLWAELQVFLVQFPTAVELAQLQLQLDVALQQLVLRTFTDRWALSQEKRGWLEIPAACTCSYSFPSMLFRILKWHICL